MRWFWIDRFTEFVSGQRATAVKGVSLAEDHMHDHLVGYPIMPNSLVTEGMAQAGGLLVSEHYGFKELVVLGKVSRVSFHSRVRTGETLTYRVLVESLREDGAVVSVTAHVGERLHAKTELFFARLGRMSNNCTACGYSVSATSYTGSHSLVFLKWASVKMALACDQPIIR